ncbi:unnamed protein product [Linum trigynum]|uniref:CSC1-like protein HYP1 n=1 Tax=Linum trigynum TaxID=586398 RepID=A0AAV2F1U6_9ROSI
MILSALLTSVGINLGLCFLFFTLYSVLRKQPWNTAVYAPRQLAKQRRKSQNGGDEEEEDGFFNFDMLLPSAGWVRRAWQVSEDELLCRSGLDAVVFIRIFVFSSRVFAIGGAIGIFVLLPVNYLGNQLSIDFYDLPNKNLETFSISNVNDGSNWLWVHFSAAYIFTGVVCYLLYYEYNHISLRRIASFHSSPPQPHNYTIVVRGIPSSGGRSFSEAVQAFFTDNHPSTYLSHVVVHRTSKIRSLIKDAEKLYRTLARVKSQSSQQINKRDRLLGLFRGRDTDVSHYEQKLEDLERNVRTEQHSLTGELPNTSVEVPAAFVSFKSRFGAAVALHMQQGADPTEWLTEEAPEPRDIHWSSFSSSFMKRWISRIVVVVACVALTILFLIPVVLVQGLANLEQLETWFPFLKGILDLTIVSQIVTGYLPSLILQLFLYLVPPIMLMLSSMEGYLSSSSTEKSACTKVLWFTIWNIFFANVLSGSAFYQVNIFLEPKNIPKILAEAVPGQATFFISYVVTSGWTKLSSEISQLTSLLWSYVTGVFSSNDDEEIEVPKLPYHSEIPRILFFGLLGTTYFFLAPLILPFLLIYFCIGYITFRNQLLNVYEPKYETNGRFWPIVHGSTIFSLILMHVIAIGIFGLKKLPLASTLTVPLPILTLLFNEYCSRRFVPLFQYYPTESIVNKDKEDQNRPNMAEFYDKLVTAYCDPALLPVQYARNNSSLSSPLLQSQV